MTQGPDIKKFDLVITPGAKRPDRRIVQFVKTLFGMKRLAPKTYKPRIPKPRKPSKIR